MSGPLALVDNDSGSTLTVEHAPIRGGWVDITITRNRHALSVRLDAEDLLTIAHQILAKAQEDCGTEEIEQAMALLVVNSTPAPRLTDTDRAIGDYYDRCAAEGRSSGD